MFQTLSTFLKKWPRGDFGVEPFHDYLKSEFDTHVGKIVVAKVAITAAQLATAGTPAIYTPAAGEEWALRDLKIGPGALTNFHSGGDRLLAIQSGSNVFSLIPNASLETLVAAAWGATALPFPATAAHGDALITATDPLEAAYSGGSADHASGSITIQAVLERVT